jgi:hypothetical protein
MRPKTRAISFSSYEAMVELAEAAPATRGKTGAASGPREWAGAPDAEGINARRIATRSGL